MKRSLIVFTLVRFVAVLATLLAGLAGQAGCFGQVFTVSSLNDGGILDLRSAIVAANSASGPATIQFNIAGGGTINLNAGMLPLLRNPHGLIIDGSNNGNGAITINGLSTSNTTGDRIFFSNSTGVVTLRNLNLVNGNARGGHGSSGGGGGAGPGGAIFVNQGSLILDNVSFAGNRAIGGNGGILLAGAGGGGGMGGNGGMPGTASVLAGGGGGFGLGANGGGAEFALGAENGLAGRFEGGAAGGNGGSSGGNAGSGGAMGGGGGGAGDGSDFGAGGGGGVGGSAATSFGSFALPGQGGFGGGGGGNAFNDGTGGNGGFGGGGGGSRSLTVIGGNGGFGGGGGASGGSADGFGGIGGGNAFQFTGGGGMGAGANVFINSGATLSVMNSDVAAGSVAGGTGGNAGTGRGSGFYLHENTTTSVHVGISQSRSINGELAGQGTLTKTGGGSLILTAASTLSTSSNPTVQVLAGRLIVNNTSGSGTGSARVAVLAGAALAGNGHIAGPLTIAAGARLEAGDGVGVLTTGGSLTLDALAESGFELGGTVRGTGYDSLTANGAVTLGGALDLDFVNGFAASIGDRFTLIEKSGSALASGTFSGLAEGSEFSAEGISFRISYAGGDGNDVELTTVAIPEPGNLGVLVAAVTLLGLRKRSR